MWSLGIFTPDKHSEFVSNWVIKLHSELGCWSNRYTLCELNGFTISSFYQSITFLVTSMFNKETFMRRGSFTCTARILFITANRKPGSDKYVAIANRVGVDFLLEHQVYGSKKFVEGAVTTN